MCSRTTLEDYFSRKRKQTDVADDIEDGFTVEELTKTDREAVDRWRPRLNYEEVLIGELAPGPRRLTFMARVVNIYDLPTASKSPRAAKGCLKILAKDDTGCILISLWYIDVRYVIGIGSLLSIWSPHVSAPKPDSNKKSPAPLITSIFPERDGSCHVVVHENNLPETICRIPLGYREGQLFIGLSSLTESRELARNSLETRVLLLVKVVGTVTSVTNSKGQSVDKVDIGVGDESGEAVLTLFGIMMLSALQWTPLSTVLLVSGANWRPNCRLSVTARTMIEVDPDIVEAEWLRRSLVASSKHINQPYPDDLFDVETLESAAIKLKFSLADIDEFVRAQPNDTYMGYMNLLITEVNLLALHRRDRLYSAECCNMPIFANNITADCGQCGKVIDLTLNPQIHDAELAAVLFSHRTKNSYVDTAYLVSRSLAYPSGL